jgi:hypothetical protein
MVSILVAVDGSQQGMDALLWVCKNIWKPEIQLDVVAGAVSCPCQFTTVDLACFPTLLLARCPASLACAVLPPVAMNVYPVAPVATAAAVAAVTHQWEAQKQHDEAHATEVLRDAVHQAIAAGVSCSC